MFRRGPFEDLKTGAHVITVVFLAKPVGSEPKVTKLAQTIGG